MPGDKSISHRALILAALGRGKSRIRRVNVGRDVRASADALAELGADVRWDATNSEVEVEGHGWGGLREPASVLDVDNSGTSMRLLAGLCATVDGLSVLTGDESLRRRPMLRVVEPLRRMGATLDGRSHGERPPLVVRGGQLSGIEWEMDVASAQVKSAVLLAGLRAAGKTSVIEPQPSRDHTERMLVALGGPVARQGPRVTVGGHTFEPPPIDLEVPGDLSSAMFLIVAAALVPGSELRVCGVGLNPTRAGALDALGHMGARLEAERAGERAGEPVGSVVVSSSDLSGIEPDPGAVATFVDELPLLAVAATQAEGETVIRGAAELRVKESDRIAATVEGLRALGARIEPRPDGMVVRGPTSLGGGEVDSHGDHRIALALAVAGLVASERVRVRNWDCVDTSFPEFLTLLSSVRGLSGGRK